MDSHHIHFKALPCLTPSSSLMTAHTNFGLKRPISLACLNHSDHITAFTKTNRASANCLDLIRHPQKPVDFSDPDQNENPKGILSSNYDNIYSQTADSLYRIVNFTTGNVISTNFKSGSYRYMTLICSRLAVSFPHVAYGWILSLQTYRKGAFIEGIKKYLCWGTSNPMVHF